MRLVFVTPAFGRYTVTDAVLAQRANLELLLHVAMGIEAATVVIADDDNLDIARAHGMEAIERPNTHLGAKFNDGIEHACIHMDADLVCLIGSDSWVHPAYFTGLDQLDGRIRTGRDFGVVNETGTRFAHTRITYIGGVGPKIIPRDRLAWAGFRPAEETKPRGIDMSVMGGLLQGDERQLPLDWFDVPDLGALRTVDFKNPGPQLNRFDPIVEKYGTRTDHDPWTLLATAYPQSLVDKARAIYEAPTA